MTLTQITEKGIKDGEILNADINASAAIARTKLANVDLVDDTTPQLGGNLDTNGNSINFGDSSSGSDDRLNFGAGLDMNIYHDASAGNVIKNGATTFSIINYDENMIVAKPNDSVELYYDNSKKLETTSTGIQMEGNINVRDNHKVQLGNNQDLQIYHNGSHSYIDGTTTGDLYLRATADDLIAVAADDLLLMTATSDTAIRCEADAQVELYYDNSKKFETTSTGGLFSGKLHFQDGSSLSGANKVVFGDGEDLQIYHDGSDSFIKDTGTGSLILNTNEFQVRSADNSERLIKGNENGAVELYYDNSKKLETTSSGVTVTGTVTETSDIAFKSDIQPLTNTLEKIQQITGYKYNLINSISPSMGVIAQDVEKVFPELVHGSEGKKTLQYSGLIGVLVEAVKDLSAKVAALEAK